MCCFPDLTEQGGADGIGGLGYGAHGPFRIGEGGRGGDVSLNDGSWGAGGGGCYGDGIGSLVVGLVIKVVLVVMVVLVEVVAAMALSTGDGWQRRWRWQCWCQ